MVWSSDRSDGWPRRWFVGILAATLVLSPGVATASASGSVQTTASDDQGGDQDGLLDGLLDGLVGPGGKEPDPGNGSTVPSPSGSEGEPAVGSTPDPTDGTTEPGGTRERPAAQDDPDDVDPLAAPKVPRTCDKTYNIKNPPRPGTLPGERPPGAYEFRSRGDVARTYDLNWPRLTLSGLKAPTAADLANISLKKKYDNATIEHAYQYWQKHLNAHKKKGTDPGTWEDYLAHSYINGEGNGRRGPAYEQDVAEFMELGGDEWFCQYSIRNNHPDLFKKIRDEIHKDEMDRHKRAGKTDAEARKLADKFVKKDRVVDFARRDTTKNIKHVMDAKAGKVPNAWQERFDQKLAKETGARATVVGRSITPADQQRLASRGIGHHTYAPVERRVYTPTSSTAKPSAFQIRRIPGGNLHMFPQSPVADLARQSGKTPTDARRIADAFRRAPNAMNAVRAPGGIDWTSLELRYITEPAAGEGMEYSFKAGLNDDEANPSWGGQAKLDLASDSFFTWLALHPNRFWVNLHPDQPDVIVDDKFAETDAGRVLLEADLEMKHDFARLMAPGNPVGDRFWDSLAHENGAPCWSGYRMWIEPHPAQVREEDGRFYIIDAPLNVSVEPWDSLPGQACDQPQWVQDHNDRQIQEIIAPEVEEIVNADLRYADLRTVYTSRVAAEWVKERNAERAGAYNSIIGSDDASAWPSRVEWDRNAIFAEYRKSYYEGDFHFTREYEEDGVVLEYEFYTGGVMFDKQPKENINRLRFQAEHPEMPVTTSQSAKETVRYGDIDSTTGYLGGDTAVVTDPGPAPSPTTPPPSGPPTPAPPPDMGDGREPEPSPTKDPVGPTDGADGPDDGELAATGPSGTSSAVLVAILLIVAGTAFILWSRYQRTARLAETTAPGSPRPPQEP
ncbi:hypothetical protein [Promicromonospora soli]|uniref:LPXTG-motif cell wall-anchored protein n=1 Tax=Promicromonospora soli TaxID=2035533 RepID=A0A919FIA4_9MICO|nr:hypothetical protein [Promicromonospora soli]GHH65516.1 hypothetical protein GCM10017772_03860 [Promicromonospora soli]